MKNISPGLKRILFFIFFDVLAIVISVILSYELRFDFEIPLNFYSGIFIIMLMLIVVRISLFYLFKIYDISWRHFGFNDTVKLINGVVFSTLILLGVTYILLQNGIVVPRSVISMEFFISLFLILALRISKRLYLERYKGNALGKYTIVIAEPDRANTIIRSINTKESEYYPIAIIDDKHHDVQINGIQVYSFDAFKEHPLGFEAIIVDENVNVAELYKKLHITSAIDIKIATAYSNYKTKLQDISVEDLLARSVKDLDKEKIGNFIYEKVILITGAGGSIGSELSRQCIKYKAKQLILLDHSEYNLYAICEELEHENIVPVMQNVTHYKDIEKTFAEYKPDIVIHAAAYKHVPLVEFNIEEGIKNNILGTKNVIDISIKYQVEKFIMVSTDKAVRPTNVMGTTKRICELYVQNVDAKDIEIVAVRFGNVLGSSGSVIPKFKAQISSGGPITVTHPDITRYFMLIPEACELVLQAGAMGKGGEIFILDMGEPIKIVDLAKKMIELSGKKDIKIEFSGLRPGEKLYEELLINESDAQTEYKSITIAKPTSYDIEKLNEDIKELLICKDKINKLKQIVPEFDHHLNLKRV